MKNIKRMLYRTESKSEFGYRWKITLTYSCKLADLVMEIVGIRIHLN